MREQLGDRLPRFSDADFAILRNADTHFYGMNYYTSQYARHRDSPASATDYVGNVDELSENKEGVFVGEQSGIHWLRSCPDMFRQHLARVYRLYGKPIYITENGCPCPGEDKMGPEEAFDDPFRIRYFEKHLDAINQAIYEDGAVVSGYFAWALMDNLGMYSSLMPWSYAQSRKEICSGIASDVFKQNGPMGMVHGLGSHTLTMKHSNARPKSRHCFWRRW
jgi:beta-glucosidase